MNPLERRRIDPPAVVTTPGARGWETTLWPIRVAALAALGITAGALFLSNLSRPRLPRRARGPAAFGPADKTIASSSPAVLGSTPERRFYRGGDLARAITIEDLRAMARRRLPRFALEYLEAGGEDEATLARNIAAFAEWHFFHRSLVDISQRDVSATLFGDRMSIPVGIAPTGLNELFWPHADLRLAEAAAQAGVPFAQSTMSNDPMDDVARVPGLRHWWQLYVFGPPEIRRALMKRAQNAGCEALIVTTDAQLYGNREWHKRNTSDPKTLTWNAKLDAALHPRWFASGLLTHGMPRFENVV